MTKQEVDYLDDFYAYWIKMESQLKILTFFEAIYRTLDAKKDNNIVAEINSIINTCDIIDACGIFKPAAITGYSIGVSLLKSGFDCKEDDIFNGWIKAIVFTKERFTEHTGQIAYCKTKVLRSIQENANSNIIELKEEVHKVYNESWKLVAEAKEALWKLVADTNRECVGLLFAIENEIFKLIFEE